MNPRSHSSEAVHLSLWYSVSHQNFELAKQTGLVEPLTPKIHHPCHFIQVLEDANLHAVQELFYPLILFCTLRILSSLLYSPSHRSILWPGHRRLTHTWKLGCSGEWELLWAVLYFITISHKWPTMFKIFYISFILVILWVTRKRFNATVKNRKQ